MILDPTRKTTLELIVRSSGTLSIQNRGRQLLFVVRDYLEDNDTDTALTVLSKVDPTYFDDFISQDILNEPLFSEAIAYIVDLLGIHFRYLASPNRAST